MSLTHRNQCCLFGFQAAQQLAQMLKIMTSLSKPKIQVSCQPNVEFCSKKHWDEMFSFLHTCALFDLYYLFRKYSISVQIL